MVARSPPKMQRKLSVTPLPLNPILLRETVNKVDRCMARLQELQHTVTGGGGKVVGGVNLSPRSTRGYLKTSLRCKQESLRIKNVNSRRSPGKLPANAEDWRRMSLPAMLLGETIGEIVKTSQFARSIVDTMTKVPLASTNDPKTPLADRRKQNQQNVGNPELLSRRKREKQPVLQNGRSESDAPSQQRRAKSRINFKISPVRQRECDKENPKYMANRVSPRNKPWARKTVLFPNPTFHSSPPSQNQKFCRTKSPLIGRSKQTPTFHLSPTSQHQKFCRTKSPVIARSQQTPHKFLIKSPYKGPQSSKFQVKIKSPPLSISPTRASKKPSPSKASSTAAKLRRSFSPSRLANKLVSPLKSRKSVPKSDVQKKPEGMMRMMSGLKQRPATTSATTIRFSPRRI